MNIVLVPCYKRSEMLFHCLLNLSRAKGIENHRVVVCEDNHVGEPPDNDNAKVVGSCGLIADRDLRVIEPHRYWGNNWNTLKSYEWASRQDCELVYLVEEDVIVGEDFFTWHETVQRELQPFCSIGVRHLDIPTTNDPRQYFETHAFASLGVCFPKVSLSCIRHGIPAGYFDNPIQALDGEYPNSIFKGAHGAQDGLISRIMERHGLRSVFPLRPRAFHAGWYGFNRDMSTQPQGTLQERIDAVGLALSNRGYVPDMDDCQPCELAAAPWDGELIKWKP